MSLPIDSTEEVLSGEAVAIDVLPLGYFPRVLGAVIDMLFGFALFVLFFWIRVTAFAQFADPAIDRILFVVGTVFCFFLIPLVLEVALKGRSLGKLAVGGRIVRLDGGAIGFRHAFIRALLGVLEIFMSFGSIAAIVATFNARSQRLGDMIAGTYSQRVRPPKWNVHPLEMPPALAGWATVADVARLPDRLARRIAQFLQSAPQMHAASRARVGAELLQDAAPYVSPMPPGPPEVVLTAMRVVRRERERTALLAADRRAERLTGKSLSLSA